uniref:PCI domain-containing protein n=1 Tax=Haptolina brevifila TaxID=156173 RepID=A0A7S2BW76_9EUKA
MADAVAIKTEQKVPTVSYAAPIAEQKALAKSGNVEGAIANLLQLEKTTRLGGDQAGTKELCVGMVEICYEANDFPRLNETITMLSKRRAQIKDAVGAMVRKGIDYLDALTGADKLTLIETLRAVSEGKMFVEVERARLTKMLAGILEARGDKKEACKILIETVVETLGGMGKREKTAFILEQVRLCLDTEDTVRAQIMSRKINVKVFQDDEIEDLKLSYYSMIVRYHLHSHNWLEIFRAYQAMWGSKSLMDDAEARSRNLKLQCIYLMLSAYDNEQNDQMHILSKIPQLADLAMYKELVRLFITKEVFHFADLESQLRTEIEALGSFDAKETDLMLTTFHRRVTEHNIEVVSQYYARIRIERLAMLLQLDIPKMEEQLCEMVTKKQVYARINRPKGIIDFTAPKSPNELLNDWSSDIATLLSKLEGTCHLIHKENMVHKITT